MQCNDERVIFIRKNKVFGCGQNDCYQLGLEETFTPNNNYLSDNHKLPHQLTQLTNQTTTTTTINNFHLLPNLPKNNENHQSETTNTFTNSNPEYVRMITSGAWHSVILSTKNKLFVVGKNNDGQCCHRSLRLIRQITKVEINNKTVEEEIIKSIHCGKRSTILLLENGNVYSCGYNYYGQLGIETEIHLVNEFIKAKIENVKEITCGSYHTLFITKENRIFACGDNYYGQLALGDTLERKVPTRITFLDKLNDSIKMISCGELHTVFLSKKGNAYVCGRNSYGQLGLGNKEMCVNPTLLQSLSQQVEFIACGWNHSVFLLKNQKVFCCGRNKHGELGVGDFNDRISPTLLTTLDNIQFVQCGRGHTIFKTKKYEFYFCGTNIQQGDYCLPTLINLPQLPYQSPSYVCYLNSSSMSRSTFLIQKEIRRLNWFFIRLKRRAEQTRLKNRKPSWFSDISIIVLKPKKQLVTVI
ncbi:hypothetical protein ABK040_004520 [Willaertia magna]